MKTITLDTTENRIKLLVSDRAYDADAIHDNVAGEIAAITEKLTIADDDLFLIEDSEDSNSKKRVKKSTIPTGVTDHGALTGLADDDHTQYLTETRHDALPADNPHSVTAAQVGALTSGDIDTLAELNAILTDATLDDSSDSRTPTAHAASHSDGGSDEISVENLATGAANDEIFKASGGGVVAIDMDALKVLLGLASMAYEDAGDYVPAAGGTFGGIVKIAIDSSAGLRLVSLASNAAIAAFIDLMETDLEFGQSGGYGARIKFDGSINQLAIQMGNSTSVSDAVFIDRNTGDVGIGLVAAEKFHVGGNARVDGLINAAGGINEAAVTEHQAALSITESQISDLGDYQEKDATILSKSANYTVQAADAGKIIECDGTFTVTLPNSLDSGFQVVIVNVGSGTITIAASTTLQSKDSNTDLANQYGAATVYHRGSNVWCAFGDLS